MTIAAFSGFSGAGAVLLGEWLGWRHAGACDRDAFCRAVIAHRLPGVPLFDDMEAVPWENAWSGCSQEDGHASLTASPASGSPTPTSATDGDTSSPPFAVVDPTSRSLRTSQESFLPTTDDIGPAASPTCPPSGTMRSGWCWERTLPAPTIAGSGCGSSRGGETWPTPCATDAASAASAASAANRTSGRSNPDSAHHDGTTLLDAVRLWPTPNATASNDGETWETWETRRSEVLAKGINGNGMGMPLSIAVQKAGETRTKLNPAWVATLMGWPPAWCGLPAAAIARLRQENRRSRGSRRGPASTTRAATTSCAPSATAGTSHAP